MAKKAADKEQVLSYEESKDLMKAARLAGRNDLIDPKGKTIRIEGPGHRRVAEVAADEATGDDGNTASPGAAGTTRTQ